LRRHRFAASLYPGSPRCGPIHNIPSHFLHPHTLFILLELSVPYQYLHSKILFFFKNESNSAAFWIGSHCLAILLLVGIDKLKKFILAPRLASKSLDILPLLSQLTAIAIYRYCPPREPRAPSTIAFGYGISNLGLIYACCNL
jgi:hypothetical protein